MICSEGTAATPQTIFGHHRKTSSQCKDLASLVSAYTTKDHYEQQMSPGMSPQLQVVADDVVVPVSSKTPRLVPLLQNHEMLVPGINIDNPPKHIEAIQSPVDVQIIDFNSEHLSVQIATNQTLGDILAQDRPNHSSVRWINVQGLSWDVIKQLAKAFNMHPLAVEDILHESRAKLDFYDNHLSVCIWSACPLMTLL